MKLKTVVYLNLIALVASVGPVTNAQTFSVIHSFTGIDGSSPQAGVTIRAGALYGTTSRGGNGGADGPGTVYQIARGGPNWVFSSIFLFPSDKSGGALPMSRVVFGPDGHLYGATFGGGPHGDGVVFEILPPLSICRTAACSWKETVLHSFSGNPDGANPTSGDLAWNKQDDLYGTTVAGGSYGLGTVYQITKTEHSWAETPITSFGFPGSHGASPFSGVVFDKNGILYGTTTFAGDHNDGTVYSLTSFAGNWIVNPLYSFPNGEGPNSAGLLVDEMGILYGATQVGGSGGGGTVFELSPYDNWIFHPLYSFAGDPNCGPWASLTRDTAGNLYGTTYCNGANHYGNVFKLTNTQSGWLYSSLHDFTGGSDGAYPNSGITIDTDGTLYGTASQGGANNHGTVWMIKP